ncbi:MAG: phytoene desaturase [Bacteroidetes bacterium]|nr:MAG: phytoene desaturase [Bacteroidota bacterium]
MKTAGIIGSGFAGLAAACTLAQEGFKVSVFEKNEGLGGRARKFDAEGFLFDMGPSWYWMPEVFENFFNKFGKSASDYYELVRLDPSYNVIFGKDDIVSMPASYDELEKLFEEIEPGSSENLRKFLAEAEYKYKVGMEEFVWKPGLSLFEFADIRVLKSVFKLQMFTSLASQVEKLFKNQKLREILKFPVLFLGATPENTPALYSLMNHADLSLGTWYPMGGMHKIIEGFVSVAKELGVEFFPAQPVERIDIVNGKATGFTTGKKSYKFDYIVAGADYHHVEQNLLPEKYRSYTPHYWEKRTMAPSSLLFYLGLDKKIDGLQHHNLFFDRDFDLHAKEIYTDPAWPTDPLFYVSCPSKTDTSVAPEGKENVFILMPLAPGISDSDELREKYFHVIAQRMKDILGVDIREHILYKRSYCLSDFVNDYNAFKGNAYGLANTLKQTAILKPRVHHDKVPNLYYAGQLTSPGPGMPPSIISGQMVGDLIAKRDQK